jgi:phospholipase C
VDCSHELFPGSAEFPAGPYGLGMRVPMLVISPWSTGGWVNSQLFDHTSLIRFIQARFGAGNPLLSEKNITAWRSAVSGDLTSAFHFSNGAAPAIALPNTAPFEPPDDQRHGSYSPTPPQRQTMPLQETGTRPACGLPYVVNGYGYADFAASAFKVSLSNSGSQTAVFQVRSGNSVVTPHTFTVQPQTNVLDIWPVSASGAAPYNLSVYGPNGFLRAYTGCLANKTQLQSVIAYNIGQYGITLQSQNLGSQTFRLQVLNFYTGQTGTSVLAPGRIFQQFFPLKATFGWYELVITVESDPTFRQQLAGHLETGLASRTDPGSAGNGK